MLKIIFLGKIYKLIDEQFEWFKYQMFAFSDRSSTNTIGLSSSMYRHRNHSVVLISENSHTRNTIDVSFESHKMRNRKRKFILRIPISRRTSTQTQRAREKD